MAKDVSTSAGDTPEPAPRKRLITRRRLLIAAAGAFATGASTLAYATQIAPSALSVEHVTIAIPNLPARWRGKRIVHLSDLHCGGRVDSALINRAMEMAGQLSPMAVVITGDLVENTAERLPEILPTVRTLADATPVYAILGNHDYVGSINLANRVSTAFAGGGVMMLRNQAHQPFEGDAELTFVGLEDLWRGRFDPAAAFAQVRGHGPAILLSHNPDSYERVDTFNWSLMLCGHTHGGQVRLPLIGALHVPIEHKDRSMGLIRPDPRRPDRAMYVTRGVGHLYKIRLFCPPEVTCITLVAGGVP